MCKLCTYCAGWENLSRGAWCSISWKLTSDFARQRVHKTNIDECLAAPLQELLPVNLVLVASGACVFLSRGRVRVFVNAGGVVIDERPASCNSFLASSSLPCWRLR